MTSQSQSPDPSASAHADASPSSSSTWIVCPASVTQARGKSRRASVYTAEGSVAHVIAEAALRGEITPGRGQRISIEGFEIEVTEEMLEAIDVYTAEVSEILETAKRWDFEARVSLDLEGAETIYGTCDTWAVSEPVLDIIDFKYGQGVEVPADSPQLKIYALGVLNLLGPFVDIEKVTLTVVQPRAGGIKRHVMDLKELLEWERSTLIPAVARLNAGDATEVTGGHCRWCVRAGECRGFASMANDLARTAFGQSPPDPTAMSNDELGQVLDHAEIIGAWVTKVRGEVSARIDNGQQVPGWKLVAKRAVTKWDNEIGALAELLKQGIPFDEISRIETIGTVKKVMRRYHLHGDLLDPFTVKESSGSTLVAENNSREALATGAKSVFIEIVEEEK